MKKILLRIMFFTTLILFSTTTLFAQWQPTNWPVLKHYDQNHLKEIALPIGGIGTGTVSLGGRGELRDWEIMNTPAKHFSSITKGNEAPFFAVYVKPDKEQSKTLSLLGPLYDSEYLHYEGRSVDHHGLPRFREASFDAAYPFGQVNLSSYDVPIKVKIKGFNPLIPSNEHESGLPIAILTYEVTNTSNKIQEVAVCGTLRNFIGRDGHESITNWKGDNIPTGAKQNKNQYKQGSEVQGVYMYSDGVDKEHIAWGTIALTTNAKEGVSYRTSSGANEWGNALLDFWDDFSADGVLSEKDVQVDDDPMASLAVKQTIAPNETKSFTFFLTWNFPNRVGWANKVVGNYYSAEYSDAWLNAEVIVPQIPKLEAKTLRFVNSLLESSYPDVVKEAALFNLSTLRSQTVFRIPSGHMMGWEGIMDRFGSCMGNCTHVWNYEVATPFLFGNLARSMRDIEFNYATKDNGLMNFRANLPLEEAKDASRPATDGQMGCVMKFYREWQLYGNNEYLRSNWGQIKKVLSYAWVERGWDGNQDGVMEGQQHNTMDVDYFGPNPQMGFWYMGALRAAEQMAIAMKDNAFAAKCSKLYRQGSNWMDSNLFNGEYYEHKITSPETFEFIDIDNPNSKIPDFQLGRGCLVDQLVGQYMAHICGLGYLGDEHNIKTTLNSIMKYNWVDDFSMHFNNMRSYVMGDEAGLLMASWPKGRLKVPFSYFAEVMTGFEYSTAVHMIYEGHNDNAIKIISAIRDRHNGSKRNPFSEPECGHHYARAMASWGAILALSDFHYSRVAKTMNFTHKSGKYFWSNGYSWGLCEVTPKDVILEVLNGEVNLQQLTLSGVKKPIARMINIKEGEKQVFRR